VTTKALKRQFFQLCQKKGKVIVEGCKIAKKTVKPTEENPKGGFMNKEMPIDISNVRKVEA
jgi:large subunit ribosomal protein L24